MLFGPRERSAFDRSPKEGRLSLRSEGAVYNTTPRGESNGWRSETSVSDCSNIKSLESQASRS
jgi:hypothetical protein